MKAVILAGGKGKRLRPLTSETPKPMVKICNKPCIGHILELLKKNGINDVAVTVGYKPQKLIEYLTDYKDMNIHIYEEDTPLGTAGSVKKCADFFDGDFLVIGGDCICDLDLKSAISYHKEKGGIATIVTVSTENPTEYGLVFSDKYGRIQHFDEKPGWEQVGTDRVNTGIYIFKKEILNFIPSGEYDFGSQLFPLILSSGRSIYAHHQEGFWEDIGGIEAYRYCNFHKLGEQPIQKQKRDSSVKIIQPCIIGKNTHIKSGALIGPYAIIGDNCQISEGAHLYNCIIEDNVKIGQSASVQGIVCSDSVLGNMCEIGADAVIGTNCKIGNKSIVSSCSHIYPDSVVEDGIDISISLYGKSMSKGLFSERGIEGDMRYDITPNFATRLGTALEGAFSEKVLIAYSNTAVLLLANSTALGASGVGINTLLAAASLSAAKYYSAEHCIPLIYFNNEKNRVRIQFFDAGLPLNYIQERKIKNSFYSEEIAGIEFSKIKLPQRLKNIDTSCQNRLEKILPKTSHQLIIYGDAYLSQTLRKAVSKAGGGISDGLDIELNEDGSKLTVNQNGFKLSQESILGIICLFEKTKKLPIPNWQSGFLNDRLNIDVIAIDADSFLKYPYFYDNVFMAAKLLSIMETENKTLEQLEALLPEFHAYQKKVLGMGRAAVIASLKKLVPAADVSGRGINITTDSGQVNIIPLKMHEGFLVSAFSGDTESSKELCGDMCDIIKSIDNK